MELIGHKIAFSRPLQGFHGAILGAGCNKESLAHFVNGLVMMAVRNPFRTAEKRSQPALRIDFNGMRCRRRVLVLGMLVKNKYETVIVLSAKLGEEGNAELVEKFKALIAKHGTVESVDEWGKRRLAYPINKETEGYYTLVNFESTPDFTAELDRRYKITDGVLRSIIVKKDPRFATAAAKPRKAAEPKPIDVEAVAAEAVEANESAAE